MQHGRKAGREEEGRQRHQDKKEGSVTRETEDAEVRETIGMASMTYTVRQKVQRLSEWYWAAAMKWRINQND